ncbi:MAG: hypothetical protein F4Z01_00285 [Gammaproteobacteria bacterium]|nr:hypothetical protein [Gammaproteobacteria bacterium]MYF38048.1 hypothetical protein [Gammaproteobacteria bacterium]
MSTSRAGPTSLSFLDVIACAFGAIVLLVLILPVGERAKEEPESVDFGATGRLFVAIDAVDEEIQALAQELQTNQKLLTSIESESVSIEDATEQATQAVQHTITQLNSVQAQQSALATAAAILSQPAPQTPETQEVESELSGIPVDSEYLVFVVDTSGSMQSIWSHVIKEMERFWLLYPDIKGFQIMNDNGHYLSRIGKGRWIPDNKLARKTALQKMQSWLSFSNSSPAEGIVQAIDDLYRDDIKMAIVVVGDEYSSGSFTPLLEQIDRKVRSRSVKADSLRIHALGFWNMVGGSGNRFAMLMRALTARYDGAFVAIEANSSSVFTMPSPIPPIKIPLP